MKTLKLIKECTDADLAIKESDIAEDIEYVMKQMYLRGQGGFRNKAIWLNDNYDYVLGKDDQGETILVPLKKK